MKLKICVALLALCLCAVSLFADNVSQQATVASNAQAAFGALPLSFEPTATSDRYLSRSGRYAISLGATESSIAVTDKSGNSRMLRFAFENGNASSVLSATDVLPGVTNYYVGNDRTKWRVGVKNYARVHAKGVYPGVDVVYYGEQKHLEFDFVVAPGADPRAIAMTFAGMNSLKTNADGALVADLGERAIAFQKPLAYQVIDGVRRPVSVEYVMAGADKARLNIGAYDKSRELVIDPVITYSLYMGGSGGDSVNGIAVNSQGEAYITGQTCSTDFYMPAVNPSDHKLYKGSCDAFVAKLNSTGSAVLFTTLIAGQVPEPVNASASVNGIALDNLAGAVAPNVYVVGTTNYRDLPVTPAAADPTVHPSSYNGGDSDAFIMILNASDGTWVRGTYLGGGSPDLGYGIAVDSRQNVIVAGQTCSLDFPAYNSFQAMTEPCVAFATKLDFGLHIPNPVGPGASALSPRPLSKTETCINEPCPAVTNANEIYFFSSTMFGGQLVPPYETWIYTNGVPFAPGTIIRGTPPKGEAQILISQGSCVAGGIPDANWPETVSVGKVVMDACGTVGWKILGAYKLSVYASTEAYGVALDPIGDIYFVGGTNTKSLVPYSRLEGTGPFIVKVRGDGALIYSSALGTVPEGDKMLNAARAVAVDVQGRAYVVGSATGGIYTSAGTIKSQPFGGVDAFAMRLNIAGSAAEYSTYLGGKGDDEALSVAADLGGWAYIGGKTTSADIPMINPVFDPNNSSFEQLRGQDGYIVKLSPDGSYMNMSAYYGGAGAEQINAIAVSSSGNIFVGGQTNSPDLPVYPTTANPEAGFTLPGGSDDGFVAMLLGTTFPKVAVSPKSLNFGNQVVGTSSAGRAVTFQNVGLGQLKFQGTVAEAISITGDFTQTNDCKDPLSIAGGSNDTCTITVTFTPTASGTRTGTVTIKDNAPDTPQLIGLVGTGTQIAASIDVTSLSFGNQATSTTSATKFVTIRNNDAAQAMSITNVALSATTPTDFRIESNDCGSTLLAGASCKVGISFSPSVLGNRTGALNLDGNGSAFPASIQLQGTGVLVSAMVSTTSLSFTTQPLDQTSAPQTITIDNKDATQSLVVGAPKITDGTGAVSTEFLISANTCGAPVAHGTSCTMQVTFKPAAAGTRTATLKFDGNGSSFPVSVSIQGIGGQPAAGGAGDYTVSGPTGGVTIAAGATGQFDVSAAGTGTAGFTGSVGLTCTVPSPATCSISPAAITMSGTTPATAKVTVVVPGPKSPNPKGAFLRIQRTLEPVFAFCLFGLTIIGRRRRMVLLAVVILAFCLILGMSGCGGGGGTSSNYNSDTGMLPGNYTMRVTATYVNGSTQVSHYADIPLHVQ